MYFAGTSNGAPAIARMVSPRRVGFSFDVRVVVVVVVVVAGVNAVAKVVVVMCVNEVNKVWIKTPDAGAKAKKERNTLSKCKTYFSLLCVGFRVWG